MYTRPLIVNEMLVSGRPPPHPQPRHRLFLSYKEQGSTCCCGLCSRTTKDSSNFLLVCSVYPTCLPALGVVTLPVHHCRWKLSPAESQCFKPARMAQLFLFPKPLAGCLSPESLCKYAGWSKEGMLVLGALLPYSAPSWLMIK